MSAKRLQADAVVPAQERRMVADRLLSPVVRNDPIRRSVVDFTHQALA